MRSGEHKVARLRSLSRGNSASARSAAKQTTKPEHLVNIVRAGSGTPAARRRTFCRRLVMSQRTSRP